jgi:DNA-binding NarL/FixJ family response regulator
MTDTVKLTEREKDVLSLLAEGLTNKEIGARLSLSEKTIKVHVSSLFKKLRVPNRTAAAMWWVIEGRFAR